jgi:hypothetical protein
MEDNSAGHIWEEHIGKAQSGDHHREGTTSIACRTAPLRWAFAPEVPDPTSGQDSRFAELYANVGGMSQRWARTRLVLMHSRWKL